MSAAYRQTPLKSSTGTLTISVIRNEFCPQFNSAVQVTVSETVAVGTTVIRMNATDADGDDVIYSLVNQDTQTRNLFFIEPHTGEVITRNLLSVSFKV